MTGRFGEHGSGPVVAGVDGSESATHAVRWAAAEAARRDVALRLVYACSSPGHDYPNLEVTAADVREAMRETGARRLRAAQGAAWTVAPELVIETEVRDGDPRVVLVEESERAAVLVLGSRGLTSAGRLLLGSSGLALAMHGRCPLVVVRGSRARSGPVLVGVDGWPASTPAVRFAFQEAADLATSVTALRTWNDLAMARSGMSRPRGSVLLHEAERRSLAREVSSVAREFPDVPFDCLVVKGRPGRVLEEYGERAGLIVVGTRGRSGFAGLLLGSVSQDLAVHAPCPVAIVRADIVVPGAVGTQEPLSLEGDGA